MSDRDQISAIRACWSAPSRSAGDDYALLAKVYGAYAARSQLGLPTLVVPLTAGDVPTVGRRASGCELLGHSSIRFVYEGREWTGPAAALICTDADLVDAFAVLATDVARRVQGGATWPGLVTAVEEWQTLLSPRGKLSQEAELGLWGELWFLAQSSDLGRLLAAWRGPEGDVTDFFLDGKAAEVKTSRSCRQHHVSQSQVGSPTGANEAWMVSIWVKADPAGTTVPALVDRILTRAPDRAEALRCLARAGYSPGDRNNYDAGFAVLAEPEWYAASEIPRVRAIDPGVSHLRYRVSLDETRRADKKMASRLWRLFHGHEYGVIER